MIDCFIVGFNDVDFESYVSTVRTMGVDKGAYRDLDLAFVTYRNKPYRSMDLLNFFRHEADPSHRPLSNVDFLWPVVTYLYSYLTKRGFKADFINLFQNEKVRLVEMLQDEQVRTVVITTTLYVWMEPILEIVDLVRKHSRKAKIIVGGPYIHNQSRLLEREILHQLFDVIGADIYVINAEGEATLARVLQALQTNGSLNSIENLAFKDGDRIVQTIERTEQNSLAEEMIDYSLFPREAYNGFVSLRTAKSCPFACAFCAFPERSGGYTYLSVDLVEKELDTIQRVGTSLP